MSLDATLICITAVVLVIFYEIGRYTQTPRKPVGPIGLPQAPANVESRAD